MIKKMKYIIITKFRRVATAGAGVEGALSAVECGEASGELPVYTSLPALHGHLLYTYSVYPTYMFYIQLYVTSR